MIRLALIAGILSACHPQPIPPPPPPVDGIPACAASVVPQQDDLCDGLFAQVGDQAYACYSCKVDQGCLAVPEQVYCAPGCLLKGLCGSLPSDTPAGAKRVQKVPKRVPAPAGRR